MSKTSINYAALEATSLLLTNVQNTKNWSSELMVNNTGSASLKNAALESLAASENNINDIKAQLTLYSNVNLFDLKTIYVDAIMAKNVIDDIYSMILNGSSTEEIMLTYSELFDGNKNKDRFEALEKIIANFQSNKKLDNIRLFLANIQNIKNSASSLFSSEQVINDEEIVALQLLLTECLGKAEQSLAEIKTEIENH